MIIEYPVMPYRETVPKMSEKQAEKTVSPVPQQQEKPAAVSVPVSPSEETRQQARDSVPGRRDAAEREEKAAAAVDGPVSEEGLEDLSPEFFARLNDRFSLALEGVSWLFIEAYPSGGIVYDGRAREELLMRFNFRATKAGKYILKFVQGSSGGRSGESRRVAVEVLPADEFLARVTGISAETRTDAEAGVSLKDEPEDDLSPEERYKAALDYLNQGEWEAAFTVLTDCVDFDPAEPSLNTAAAYAAALFMEDFILALDYANFLPSRQRDFSASLLTVGESLPARERRFLLWETTQLLPLFHGIDSLIFALARDYEAPGENRDIEAAIRCYRYLISEYPLSTYWEQAESRANYLERHFLLVR
jgi:tetratricopeptide (TPR) repeat protein